MNNENYINEETFEELVNGFEFIESFTLYGRKCLKYHIKRLQEENKQLKEQLQQKEENNQAMQEEMARTWAKLEQKENIINKTKDVIEKMLTTGYSKGLTYYYPAKNGEFGIRSKVLLEILDNKGE